MATKAKKPRSKSVSAPRQRQLSRKQTRTKAKTSARTRPALANSFRLLGDTLSTLRTYWKPLTGIIAVYLVLNVLFASGISDISQTVSNIKADLNNTGVHAHPLAAAGAGFLSLVASAGSVSSATGSSLQAVLFILISLVIIWSLRQALAEHSFGVKQAYYSAMTPLVPFLLVLLFIILQLLPVSFGGLILAGIISSLGAISGFWMTILILGLVVLAAWSIYMVSASVFGLYIVTLPDMKPWAALRSARNLVRFRRLAVLRRVFFLPIFMIVVSGVIVIPLILYATFLVAPVFYVLAALALLFAHTYMYNLYRSLLG